MDSCVREQEIERAFSVVLRDQAGSCNQGQECVQQALNSNASQFHEDSCLELATDTSTGNLTLVAKTTRAKKAKAKAKGRARSVPKLPSTKPSYSGTNGAKLKRRRAPPKIFNRSEPIADAPVAYFDHGILMIPTGGVLILREKEAKPGPVREVGEVVLLSLPKNLVNKWVFKRHPPMFVVGLEPLKIELINVASKPISATGVTLEWYAVSTERVQQSAALETEIL